MKANPTKAQTSYLIEGILIGFFVGMMISIVIDWQWIGIGAGFGQFIGGSLVHKFQNKKRGNKKWYLIIKRNLNHFINLKKLRDSNHT